MFSRVSLVRVASLALALLWICGCEAVPTGGEDAEATATPLTVSDCPAGYAIQQGTAGNDTLTGTAGNDCILGLGGNDIIDGLGGNDFLIGGSGADSLYGRDGNDELHGENNDDLIEGGAGDDFADGGAGIDRIYGQDGNDTLLGGLTNDTIEGGPGDDVLRGGDSPDTLRGGDGNDRIFGEASGDILYGDAGDDIIDGGSGNDTIWGGAGHDVIQGGIGGGPINGEAGDDAILNNVGTSSVNGGSDTDQCTGTSCELPQPPVTGCTQNSECASGLRCVADLGVCLAGGCPDEDDDGACDDVDGCPSDSGKTAPGICGCGVSDADSDGDGTASCNDGCPTDASKTAPGICGCGFSDADTDSDGTADCNDGCSSDASKTAPGLCGCGVSDADTDSDGTADCDDACPSDAMKIAAGACGCGVSDTDSDADGTADCSDLCAADPDKVDEGVCGCGVIDADTDGDGSCDAVDACAGHDDNIDSDADGIPDGCEECRVDADCEGGTECSNAICDEFGDCSVAPVPSDVPVELTNWSFTEGTFTGFTEYLTDNGRVTSAITSFDTDGDGLMTPAARLQVGLLTTPGAGPAGGGLYQSVELAQGDLSVIAKIATRSGTSNSDGGRYSLLVDGVVVASHSMGSVNAHQTYRRTLSATLSSVSEGTHEIRVQVTRGLVFSSSVLAHIDDIVLGGSAVERRAPCADGAGSCDDAGNCVLICDDADADGVCIEDDACASDPNKAQPGACGCGVLEGPDSDGDGACDTIDVCQGFDDTIDIDSNGIPDDCQECMADAECADSNECTQDVCDATGTCTYAFESEGTPCGTTYCDGAGTCKPPDVLSSISTGPFHACAIRNGAPVCWGRLAGGAADVPSTLTSAERISAGTSHSCAIHDGQISCWGTDSGSGELTPPSDFPPSGMDATEVAAGNAYTCATLGSVVGAFDPVACWGNNAFGRATPPATINGVTQLEAGSSHACAIHERRGIRAYVGVVTCWGNNGDGQLNVPTTLEGATDVALGDNHTCVLANGQVSCWGDNDEGQSTVPTLSNPTSIAAGAAHTCATTNTGVVCWGADTEAQSSPPYGLAPPYAGGPVADEVFAGASYSCAMTATGLRCWGSGEYSQTAVLYNLSAYDAGEDHACAVVDGLVQCWGSRLNDYGQLDAPPISDASVIATGRSHSYARGLFGEFFQWYGPHGWGKNDSGESSPAYLWVTDLSLGQNHSCAIYLGADFSGRVACWGNNVDGVTSVPASVTNATSLASSFRHQCALMSDRVECWGNNLHGQSDARFGSFQTIAAGGGDDAGHTCAGGAAGVQCWGSNGFGQAQPPAGLENVTHLAASSYGTCALTSSDVVCWGSGVAPPSAPPNTLELRGNHGSFCARSAQYLTCWGQANLLHGRGLLLVR